MFLGCWVVGGFLGIPWVSVCFPVYIWGFQAVSGRFQAVSGCFRGNWGVVGGKLGGIVTYTGSLVDFLSLNVRGYPEKGSVVRNVRESP